MTGRVAVVVAALIVSSAGCPDVTTGQEAYAKMTPEQQSFTDEVLARFTPSTTVEEIEAILGPAEQTTPGRRRWKRPGGSDTEGVQVYWAGEQIFMVRYMSIVSPMWAYEFRLDEDGKRLVPRR